LAPLEAPLGRLRRRRRLVPAARSGAGAAAATGAAGTAGVVAAAVVEALEPAAPSAGLRRLLRLRLGAGPGSARASTSVAVAVAAGAPERRNTLAPTSPSAQTAPSVVCTSTRHTAMPLRAPCTGGRFWVSVQRAKIVSPARTAFGNRQFTHSQAATCGIGMSIVPRPTAMATSMAGGAIRVAPPDASIVRGEKSPTREAKRAISDSEMVRRRVVHSPPRARSSKEVGSSSPEYSPSFPRI
jgi:hypothetical protein